MKIIQASSRKRMLRKPRPYQWVQQPIDGYYALLIAVIEQARKDAMLAPEAYKAPEQQEEAYYAKETAIFFLADLGITASQSPPPPH